MIDEILNNFKNSQLHKEPFWYKSVSNIFPKNYYDRLVSDLPEINSYKPINKTGTVSKNYPDERFVFDLNYENINALDEKRKKTLTELITVFTNPTFFNVISYEFKETIDNRISSFNDYEKENIGINNFQFNIQAALVKDFKKYKLGVHTDTTLKFLTFLFYIPDNNNLEDLGTALYKLNEDANVELGEKGNHHISEKDFTLIKKIPFRPNTLLVFPRTNSSYHGVEKINTEGAERNLIQLNYYFKTKK